MVFERGDIVKLRRLDACFVCTEQLSSKYVLLKFDTGARLWTVVMLHPGRSGSICWDCICMKIPETRLVGESKDGQCYSHRKLIKYAKLDMSQYCLTARLLLCDVVRIFKLWQPEGDLPISERVAASCDQGRALIHNHACKKFGWSKTRADSARNVHPLMSDEPVSASLEQIFSIEMASLYLGRSAAPALGEKKCDRIFHQLLGARQPGDMVKWESGENMEDVLLVQRIDASNSWKALPISLVPGVLIPRNAPANWYQSPDMLVVDPSEGLGFVSLPIQFLRRLADVSAFNTYLLAQVLVALRLVDPRRCPLYLGIEDVVSHLLKNTKRHKVGWEISLIWLGSLWTHDEEARKHVPQDKLLHELRKVSKRGCPRCLCLLSRCLQILGRDEEADEVIRSGCEDLVNTGKPLGDPLLDGMQAHSQMLDAETNLRNDEAEQICRAFLKSARTQVVKRGRREEDLNVFLFVSHVFLDSLELRNSICSHPDLEVRRFCHAVKKPQKSIVFVSVVMPVEEVHTTCNEICQELVQMCQGLDMPSFDSVCDCSVAQLSVLDENVLDDLIEEYAEWMASPWFEFKCRYATLLENQDMTFDLLVGRAQNLIASSESYNKQQRVLEQRRHDSVTKRLDHERALAEQRLRKAMNDGNNEEELEAAISELEIVRARRGQEGRAMRDQVLRVLDRCSDEQLSVLHDSLLGWIDEEEATFSQARNVLTCMRGKSRTMHGLLRSPQPVSIAMQPNVSKTQCLGPPNPQEKTAAGDDEARLTRREKQKLRRAERARAKAHKDLNSAKAASEAERRKLLCAHPRVGQSQDPHSLDRHEREDTVIVGPEGIDVKVTILESAKMEQVVIAARRPVNKRQQLRLRLTLQHFHEIIPNTLYWPTADVAPGRTWQANSMEVDPCDLGHDLARYNVDGFTCDLGLMSVHPHRVLFAHQRISPTFRSGLHLDSAIEAVMRGTLDFKAFPPAIVLQSGVNLYAICGNRRLFLHRVLANLNCINSMQVLVVPWTSDIASRLRWDSRCRRVAPKWERAFTTENAGRYVVVESRYASFQHIPTDRTVDHPRTRSSTTMPGLLQLYGETECQVF